MTTTSIEWTDATWNPVRGCEVVSPGCVNCYAMRQAHRFSAEGQPYEGLTKIGGRGPIWTGEVRTVPEMLAEPLRWKKPRRVFVNSMSDLFHEAVPDQFIAEVFGVMAVAGAREYEDSEGHVFCSRATGPLDCGPHTFQVLTKRAERMARVLNNAAFRESVSGFAYRWAMDRRDAGYLSDCISARPSYGAPGREGRIWPLPNVWLGVSAEDQRRADERIPHLLRCPAAVRFVSVEPQVGPVDLTRWTMRRSDGKPLCAECCWKDGRCDEPRHYYRPECPTCRGAGVRPDLHWVIQGGESGPGARPFTLAWARSLRDQCKAAQVPYFFKQAGARPVANGMPLRLTDRKGGDPTEWPADLRDCRAWPKETT